MTTFKTAISIIFFLGTISLANAQNSGKVSPEDFKILVGSWKGSLTYLDYQSGKPYTMPADLKVERIDKSNSYILFNIYPNEKSANSIDTLKIGSDGRSIGSEQIKTRRKLKNGDLEIVTEKSGTDGNDNRPAIFRYTYTIGKDSYKKRKDVQFTGETTWINRHEYSFRMENTNK
jgi:hypothetical protein